MSLPLSLNEVLVYDKFTSEAAIALWSGNYIDRVIRQAEWAHLLAVEAHRLNHADAELEEWANYDASLAAYHAEFNPKAE
jgi:hypothetical protein